MDKTNIRMYLVYWLDNNKDEEVIKEFLETSRISGFTYQRVKCGDQCIKSPVLTLNTLCLDDVTKEFLNLYGSRTDELNLIAEKFDGCFVLEIVPEMYKKQKPQLGFDNEFLQFIQKLKKFKHIDIDQYFY